MDTLLLGLAFDIYSAISKVAITLFEIFTDLSLVGIDGVIKADTIDTLTKNITTLLTIVMLFYGTIIVLTYIVNPDSMKNGKNGGTAIIKKVVISLALFVMLPFIFDILADIQTSVVDENIVGRIILGTSEADRRIGETDADENTKHIGHAMIHVLTKATVEPRTDVATENSAEVQAYENDVYIQGISTYMSTVKTYAQDSLHFTFNWVFALVGSAFIALIILSFCFDISVRLFKLLFYQIIYPIPVISYVLPTKNNIFETWVKKYLKTYADLFIRLLIIYFVIFLLSSFNTSDGYNILDMSSVSDNLLIQCFVIIGLLLFAKQAPNLIMEVFGIKPEGNFTLNPMARLREVPLVGSAVHTAGAAVGGFVQGTALGFRAAGGFGGIGKAFKEGGFLGGMKNIGTMAGMSTRGMIYGGRAGYKQTSIFGQAIKDQKIDKGAYRAGASSVAQAITGNKDASAGFPDRIFNNMATHLNDPSYKQTKVIDDAKKAEDKQLEILSGLLDAKREIDSNRGAAKAKAESAASLLQQYDSSRASAIAEAINNDSGMASLNIELRDVNAELEALGPVDFTGFDTADLDLISRKSAYEEELQDLMSEWHLAGSIEEKMEIQRSIDECNNTIDRINRAETYETYTTLQNWKTEVGSKISNRRTEIENQTISSFEQVNGSRSELENNYVTANNVYQEYSRQYDDISRQVGYEKGSRDENGNIVQKSSGQYKNVEDARENTKAAKDKLKYMNADYNERK